MKTIVYIISHLKRTGPTVVLQGIIQHLDHTRFKPVIITLSDETTNSLQLSFEKMGAKVYCLHTGGLSAFLTGVLKFHKLLKEIKPDIIHANSLRDILLTAFFASNTCKKCVTIHCDWTVDYTLRYGRLKGGIGAWLQTQALKKIPTRIAVSNMLANLLNDKYPKLHFDYVNNGVDTDKFCPVTDKVVLRRQLNLPTDKKIIIWAGSFIPRKDPITMAKPILQVPDQYYFVFCGARGPLLSTCKELLKNRKNVLFTGYTTNIEQYFQASDIYVSTSLSEGFHLTVYEALACELPVILTDIEVYDNLKNNPAVCFFPSKTPAALTLQLNRLAQQNLQALGLPARQMVEKNYSAKQMAQNYMERY